MGVLRVLTNVINGQPIRWRRWHPLSSEERAEIQHVRLRSRSTPPGVSRSHPLSIRWWSARVKDGVIGRGLDLRTASLEEVLALRQIALDRGYDGHAWNRDVAYDVNESAFFWLRGGLKLAGGEIVCDLIVGQVDFKDYEVSGTRSPRGLDLKRHVLHVHRSDWRRLRRASREDETFIYLILEQSIQLDLDELGGNSVDSN